MMLFDSLGFRRGHGAQSRIRSITNLMVVFIAVAALLTTARRAHAQGVGDALPKPMTTAELVRYMQRLNLSAQQQLAVTNMHDDYKRSYAALYESEIEPFLEDMRGLSGNSMPKRDEMERIVRGMRTLEGRIRTLDGGMFDQMQTLLTDDQLVNMPRVRLAHLRACYNQQQLLQMWTMGSPIIDVSAAVQDLDLSTEDMALVDPTLARYESNITGRIGRLHDNATTLWMDIYDAIEAAGFDPDQLENMSEANPEELQKFIEFMQQTFMNLTAKGREEVNRIQDTSRQTVRSMRGVVPEGVFRKIRNSYYNRAYPNVPAMTMHTPLGVEALADVKDLAPDKRTAAEDAINRALAELDTIIENTADGADSFRESFNFMDFDQEKYQKHNEAMSELLKQATSVTERLNAQLQELFTADQFGQWQQRLAGDTKQLSPSMQSLVEEEVVVSEKNSESGEEEIQYGPDEYLPPRIGQRDLTIYLALLHATDEQQAIVKELFNTYTSGFDALEQGKIKELADLRTEIWRYNEQGQRTASAEQIDDVYARRREAMALIAELDRAFFDDVQLVLSDADALKRLQRVRDLRQRQCYNRPAATIRNYGWGVGDAEPRIDVVEFLAKQSLDEKTIDSLDPLLSQYEQQYSPLVKQRYESAVDMQRLQEVWGLRWQQIQSDEGSAAASATLMKEYQDSIGGAQKKVSSIDEQIGKLNGSIIEEAVASIPTDRAGTVRDAYQRQAFPNVFTDGAAVKDHIDRSIELNDLADDQRTTLVDLRADYQPAYDEICDRMLTLTRQSPVRQLDMDGENWAAFSEFHDKMQRLEFERAELNSRALLRLRGVLTEAQIESIGGLPEVAKPDDAPQVVW